MKYINVEIKRLYSYPHWAQRQENNVTHIRDPLCESLRVRCRSYTDV